MKTVLCVAAFYSFVPAVLVAQKGPSLDSLPQAVQASIKKEMGNSPISSISKENDGGKVEYEVETTFNGKPRTYEFSARGQLLEIEDTTDIGSIPAAAKATLQKRAAGGKITEVEKVTSGGTVSYEAEMTTGAGKKIEVAVTAAGAVKSVENEENEKEGNEK